jgi:hypothetical protein
MEEINTIDEYHAKIVEIWKKREKISVLKDYKWAFAQDKLYKNGILFLGVGASDGEKKASEGKKKSDTCIEKDSVQYETKDGRDTYDYYKPMRRITEETGFDNWSNIDITLFRETSQKKLVPFFRKFPDIMEEQLKLAGEMIKATEPKIIIVSNALVRDVLNDIHGKYKIKSGFCFDEDEKTMGKYGTPKIRSPKELEGIPVFFTSMLSGQRALDNGSFERLIWHIKFVMGKM